MMVRCDRRRRGSNPRAATANPTRAALRARLRGLVDPDAPEPTADLVARFRAAGYETILSIGELRENQIGSNCGMYAATR